MLCKPLIGLNAEFLTGQGNKPAVSAITAGYFDSIENSGGIPVIVPPIQSEDDLNCVLDRLDGFVMVGGGDLDPRNDGYLKHPTVRTMEPRREQFDRMLVSLISQKRMPVLAIGVGLQLLNVSQGGNLFFHIPDDLPEAIRHKDPNDPGHRHTLVIEKNSLIERVYGEGEIRVSSRHHMAIDEVAPGFRVTARCPDGVIEAIESEMHDWFAVGTQFHPESSAASALDVKIFEEFVDGIREPYTIDIRAAA